MRGKQSLGRKVPTVEGTVVYFTVTGVVEGTKGEGILSGVSDTPLSFLASLRVGRGLGLVDLLLIVGHPRPMEKRYKNGYIGWLIDRLTRKSIDIHVPSIGKALRL